MPKPVTPLRVAFAQSGRTQTEVAAEVGIHPSRMSLIVNGLHPDDRTRQAIAEALDRTVEDLWPDPAAAEAA